MILLPIQTECPEGKCKGPIIVVPQQGLPATTPAPVPPPSVGTGMDIAPAPRIVWQDYAPGLAVALVLLTIAVLWYNRKG